MAKNKNKEEILKRIQASALLSPGKKQELEALLPDLSDDQAISLLAGLKKRVRFFERSFRKEIKSGSCHW